MGLFAVLRNIARNKKSSTIIVLLVSVIIFLFYTGNSIISRSNQSINHAFVSSMTGDVVLQAKADVTMNLFGANTPIIDTFFNIPVFPAFDAVMEIVREEEGIESITSQVSGRAFLDVLGVREPALLCGADKETYFSMFPGIILEEGRFLHKGEYGAMITKERAQRIENLSDRYPQIGQPLLFTSAGEFGFKIREVPLVGIFSYENSGQFMNEIILIDPQTVRVLNSIQVATSSDTHLSKDALMFLDMDLDDIFSMDTQFNNFDNINDVNDSDGFSPEFLQTYLSQTRTDDDLAGGDWNFIILRLKDGVSSRSFISSINKKLEPYGVIAVDWRIAAGTSAILMLMIQAFFNLGIFLVCTAGVITVINILLISVFRRTREIGTLRAIGASDLYIGSMVLQENLILTILGGFFGVFGAYLCMIWINSLNIFIPNELIASLLGTNILTLGFIPGIAFFSFLLAVMLGFIVSIYPIQVTIRIEPIEAVRQG